MPQATPKSAPGVTLELTDPKSSYLPGDRLTGYVVWKIQQIGFVRLRLFGRIKTKIERKHATRGRAFLFDLTEVLHNEPFCGNGVQARPFSITIPTTIQPHVKAIGNPGKLGIKDEWRESPEFLSTAENNGTLPLPFSYYYAAASMGVSAVGFIEYVIQAETAVTQEASKSEFALGVTSIPLLIRMPQTAELMSRKLLARSYPAQIIAPSFDANIDKSKLSFGQKMKKTFRPMSCPRYSFDIWVGAPRCIQLDNETPFPFNVSIFPNLRPEKTNICPDGDVSKLPTVRITSLKLRLRSTTLVRCPSSWMDDESDKMHEYKWDIHDPINYLIPFGGLNKVEFAPGTHQAATHAPQTSYPLDVLDLGTLLNLRLTPLKTEAQGVQSKQLARPIWPSFKTFNIDVSYDLMYEIGIECLGEEDTIGNLNYAKSTVKILPPVHDRETKMKTKKGDFDPVAMAMEVGDLAWNVVSNVLF